MGDYMYYIIAVRLLNNDIAHWSQRHPVLQVHPHPGSRCWPGTRQLLSKTRRLASLPMEAGRN